MTNTETPKTIYLKDYQAPSYWVDTVHLRVELGEEFTVVSSDLTLRKNEDSKDTDLVLYGMEQKLVRVAVNGKELSENEYRLTEKELVLSKLPNDATVSIVSEIKPQENTALLGLYKSSGNFCTQCEPEGFRRITYYPDRPDVMAAFKTTIIADKEKYPVLLSNGNPIEQGELDGGKHFVTWEDPFKKPSYLFALVAGDLVYQKDSFTTMSGRDIELRIYAQAHNRNKLDHAMESLKQSMKWDEDTFGREYDLDLFMIVSVDDFNMGAMENKGLNIFNSALILALPETATDEDYDHIQGVIGHEYFHNWSGNRVTCRDWFQLSLKEGFTVFRDQQFSGDMTSHAVKRIEDVGRLRMRQFVEDAGPLSHPVRPESYVEINNFYTATVYEKGAEVVRMYRTLLGADLFRKGTDLYFERHDGHAATIEDFAQAMADVSGRDFTQFKRWYSQSGTPRLDIRDTYDAEAKSYTLHVRQSCPPTPGQTEKQPFLIPLSVGLLDAAGKAMIPACEGARIDGTTAVLEVTEAEQDFVFTGVEQKPVPSLLRSFSAPVVLNYEYTDKELAFLMAHDDNLFNRWDAGVKLAEKVILGLVEDLQQGREMVLSEAYAQAFGQLINNPPEDLRLLAQAMELPRDNVLAQAMKVMDTDGIHRARGFVKKELAQRWQKDLHALYEANLDHGPFSADAKAIGQRAVKNICLDYLALLEDGEAMLKAHFERANNMTDSLAALKILASSDFAYRTEALEAFYQQWKDDPLVMDKWIAIQSESSREDTIERIGELAEHPAFTLSNPNKVRALIGYFARLNPVRFHQADGRGYKLVTDYVLTLNKRNPQVAAWLLSSFGSWKRLDEARQALVREQLQRVLDGGDLSPDVYEIGQKTLNG